MEKSNNFDVKSNEELFKQALVEGVNRHIDKDIEREKQIEEMAMVVCSNCVIGHEQCQFYTKPCDVVKRECEALYNADYQKHTDKFLLKENGERIPLSPKLIICEGEWISNRQTDELICNLCGAIAPVDCEKERFYKSNFCPNCGSKMKGGEE